MALSTTMISELPLHNSLSFCSPTSSFIRRRFSLLFFASASSSSSSSPTPSVRLAERRRSGTGGGSSDAPRPVGAGRSRSSPPSAPWLQQWAPPDPAPPPPPPPSKGQPLGPVAGGGSIERIVHRLRNLGLGVDDDGEDGEEAGPAGQEASLSWNERLGELLERSWNRPDVPTGLDQSLLPWERKGNEGSFGGSFGGESDDKDLKRRRVRAPSMAELTIEDAELRRLRRLGMIMRERITVPKAGVTQVITQKIHDSWRKSELVRLKFHETLATDMRTAHELVERRTGGLVIWRSGSVMVVYRGNNYKRLSGSDSSNIGTTEVLHEGDTLFVPDVSVSAKSDLEANKPVISSNGELENTSSAHPEPSESMTEEETEFNTLLDGLGPRFVDWWGTGILPVDADLLPQTIPGYKTPFRLLPTGMRSRLTSAEMTNLRKLAKSLPCHFALGRNRHHQGLSAAILKLWEKSLIVKIAVKRGIQNTNNKLMADEIKELTGGILLLRNKYYIVIYRGKDFLSTSVATALAEREVLTKDIQDAEERSRTSMVPESFSQEPEGHALAGTLAEFQEAQARWGRIVSSEEREAMKEEASRAETVKLFKKIDHKLYIAQAKKSRADRLLAKIEASMVPVDPSDDQETITDEERSVFRKIGLRMKAYLPVGIRGVFDGVIENMHLHWKHRELVKLISKQKTLSFVEDSARLLEYESGGILVAIERVPKGFALIYYRGKNYQRPISLRPRNLLTKAKALKRAVAMQRHEALSQHIMELEENIEQLKKELGMSEDEEVSIDNQQQGQFDQPSEDTQMHDEDSLTEFEDDDSDSCDSDDDWNS